MAAGADAARRGNARADFGTELVGMDGIVTEQTAAQLKWYERLTLGDLRGREAAYTDNEAFSDLWADSPEEIGEWDITVERGPDAFAQFKLQENVHLPVLALGTQLIACCGFSRRNVLIAGRRTSVVYGQALRVRRRRDGWDTATRCGGWAARPRSRGRRSANTTSCARRISRSSAGGRNSFPMFRRMFPSARAPCPVSRFSRAVSGAKIRRA